MTNEASVTEVVEQPVARPQVPWTVKDMVWGSVAALMFTGLGIVIAVIVATGWNLLIGAGEDWDLTPYMLLALGSEALMLVPAWVWGPVKYGGGAKALGFRRWKLLQGAALLALAVVVIIAVNVGWEWVREQLNWPSQPDVLPMFGEGVGGLLMALLLGGVVAPVAEEVFFRGFVYAGMRTRWGVRWALVASSLIFAVVHLTPASIVPLFVMGLVLTYLYERTDSIWPSIILHAANNSIAFIAMYLAA